MQEKCSEERAQKGVFLTVLDADGRVLPYGSSQFCDTYAINDRDVSKVFVYVCDYIEYMDEIKGHRNDADYQRILEQRSLYWKEVVNTIISKLTGSTIFARILMLLVLWFFMYHPSSLIIYHCHKTILELFSNSG